jgi:phospholipid/cholesterol/gamma-HCH transport system substrate-binding protein
MSQYSKDEIKVGSFVFAAVVAFLFILFMMGTFRAMSGTYPLKVKFNFISGLQKGAPVRFAGAMVGKVQKVEIISNHGEGNVQVLLSMNKNVRIKKDSEIRIDTLGLMGEKYIEISPGTADAADIQAGAVLTGEDPVAMSVISKRVLELADKVDANLNVMEKFLDNSNQLVEENRSSLRDTVSNLRDISAEAKVLAKDLKANPWKLFWKTKEKKAGETESAQQEPAPKRGKFLGIF